jgi:hypothetical protein
VKAGEDALEAASIATPAMAATDLRGRMRNFMVSSRFPTSLAIMALSPELA